MPPKDNTDSAVKPLECSPEQKEGADNLSNSMWDEMKEATGKLISTVEKALPVPEFLDFNDSSLFCSKFDVQSHGPQDKAGAPKDLDPQLYEVKKGDTLTGIAKEHLGPNATAAEVQQHIKEISKLNGISNPDVISVGKKIELPGRTADGGTSVIDDEGTKTTSWPDGKLREERKDGTGFERVPDANGGFKETHFGPDKSDRYTLTVSDNGMKVLDDGEGNKVTTWDNGNEIVENKDGTGHFKMIGADGRATEQHWGPKPEDRFTLEPKADGSYQGLDEAGNKHSRWDDGTEKLEYQDGRGYVSKPDSVGGRTEHHWGPRPEDNFEVKRTPDGKTEVSEKKGDAPHKTLDDPEVKAEREKLHELAEKKIQDPGERAKFEADMARFEERAAKMEEMYTKQGMSPEEAARKAKHEVAETYRQVGKLMDAKDNPAINLDERQRIQIAEQVMSNAATPSSINQGLHPTCNVATVEVRTYTQNPSEAAKLVADVTTTGEYTTKDGSKIKINGGSLEPHDQAKTHPPIDGQRGHASQIFQVTAVNIHYQRNGDIRYEQRERTGRGDNGERLVDYSENPPKDKTAGFFEKHLAGVKDSDYHKPGLDDEQIVDVGNQITGDSKNDWYIRNGSDKIVGEDKVVNIESEKQLEDKIKEAKEKGNLPIVVKVHSGNEPFYTDSGAGRAGGSGGWHVVTITDYDPATQKVAIDNQWGSSVDHPTSKSMISVHDLFLSTKEPKDSDQIEALEKDVAANRETPAKIDYFKEAELLRLKHNNGDLNDQEYKDQLKEQIEKASEKWGRDRANNRLNGDEFDRSWTKMRDLINTLPSDQRMEVMEAAKAKGFYVTDNFYHARLEDAVVSIELQKKEDVKNGTFDENKKAEYERATRQINKMLADIPAARRTLITQRAEDIRKA